MLQKFERTGFAVIAARCITRRQTLVQDGPNERSTVKQTCAWIETVPFERRATSALSRSRPNQLH